MTRESSEEGYMFRSAIVVALLALGLITPSLASAADELSTSNRLQDRREVAAGERAYSGGFEDGRWYANGWHISGEMGGVWAPPLKLVDGVWFGVDDQWTGQATRFTSGRGYTRFDPPVAVGAEARSAPTTRSDSHRAALFGLKLTQRLQPRPHGDRQGRRPLGADGPVPVGLQGPRAEREREPARPRRVRRAAHSSSRDDGALHGFARAPLRRARRLQPHAGLGRGRGDRRRVPRAAGRARLPGRRPVGAERL